MALELTDFRLLAYALGEIAVQLGGFFKNFSAVGRSSRSVAGCFFILC